MSITRRKFLKAGAALSLTTAIPFKATAQQPRSGAINPVGDSTEIAFPTKAQFTEYLNTGFWITVETGKAIELELVDVSDIKQTSKTKEPTVAKRERFSLLFRGPNDVSLKQDTYTLNHNYLGTILMFLVPMGKEKKGKGLKYEAIVSRLAS